MEELKSTLALNLSNQANTSGSRRATLTQLNAFIILGLEYLENRVRADGVPISVHLSKNGDVTLNGFNEELVNNRNLCIYTDNKVTKSSDFIDI